MKYTKHFSNTPNYIWRRKNLRRKQTKAEKIFWLHIRKSQLGYKFRRQFQISKYIADFYCHKLKLVVEIDGWTHIGEDQQRYDAKRHAEIESRGYTVIRYTDTQVLSETNAVLQDLQNHCTTLKS
ncbi:MAG: hypothetical protein COU33_00965 [Candidatus Magasanikbacteria bacterium CG10_big_fil_rev_8_21_14_0_10_43_6]|uniref:DUF559 domain-containing protein n=1 Tax=Candidatus Magasanikbacteria bacterium CG10_big_fil_rev_8_21_14_0_10_43_6 TaxID=1974650 RepID=A0A2M6W241_9BACT|nr:MAG: hypothetical protein COU33_00965 [Candidatus Magasanikbacteria bacterium CG10_big_fil_rev_8_21_14_0_10_43_6]